MTEIIDNNTDKINDLILKYKYQENIIEDMITNKLNKIALKVKGHDNIISNHRKINDDFILRIVGHEENIKDILLQLKSQNSIIQYLISKNEDQMKINTDTILKIEGYEAKLDNIINKPNDFYNGIKISLLFILYGFIFYSIITV